MGNQSEITRLAGFLAQAENAYEIKVLYDDLSEYMRAYADLSFEKLMHAKQRNLGKLSAAELAVKLAVFLSSKQPK